MEGGGTPVGKAQHAGGAPHSVVPVFPHLAFSPLSRAFTPLQVMRKTGQASFANTTAPPLPSAA
jgi:hypothetical protein